MIKKLKVIWLCHFVNSELISYYEKKNAQEFAPWVSETLKTFIHDADFEIHIVGPNVLANEDHDFELLGIYYHLYKYRSSLITSINGDIRQQARKADKTTIKTNCTTLTPGIACDNMNILRKITIRATKSLY